MTSETRPRSETLEMLSRLIGFETVSRNSNLALIEFVRDLLADLGVDSRLTFDDAKAKANLFATIGPRDRPGVMLSGHSDVVPVEGQDWSSDPFEARTAEGRVYGRGACDMKAYIAVVLAAARGMAERELAEPIHIALSYDEELGCLGVPRLIRALEAAPVKPSACVVGEPTGMKVVTGHKGKLSMRCHVHGRAGHSGMPHQAVNAIEVAARLIAKIRDVAGRLAEEGPFDEDLDPPYSTAQTGVIKGGTALNIVPALCSFDFEFRTLHGVKRADLFEEVRHFANSELLPEMQKVAPEAAILFEEIAAYPALDASGDRELIRLVQRLAESGTTAKVSFGTEGGLFKAAGIPTVVCGPGFMAQGHKPDEFVSFAQLALAERFVSRIVDHQAAE